MVSLPPRRGTMTVPFAASTIDKMTPLERFLWWCTERHNIYLKRQQQLPKPWTSDPVLQSNFFTNPYRENDKVTAWFRDNIREPLANDHRVLFATICFRWFNWPNTGVWLMDDTLESSPDPDNHWDSPANLLTHWSTSEAVARLTFQKEQGHQIFTGAYNISNSGSTKPKINRVCEDYVESAWQRCGPNGDILAEMVAKMVTSKLTMQLAHKMLRELPGLGGSGFMAYEVVCDLRYTVFLRDAVDICTWSNPGPGAKRGINRLLGRPLGQLVKDWPEQSAKLLKQVNANLPRSMPRFEMREVEHSLCEYDKYERARLGDGHMKRKYPGA